MKQFLIIFGLQHPDETRQRRVINLPISPTNCCRTTLRIVKSDFQQSTTVISIKQLIFQIISEHFHNGHRTLKTMKNAND